MVQKHYFSHDSYDGESFGARFVRFGYQPYRYIGENIGTGNGSLGTPGAVFDDWMKSPVHRSNVLSTNFQQIGVGTASGGVTDYTVAFGTP
jgi:uncharacterized protein YkwD